MEPLRRPDTAFTSRTYRDTQKPRKKSSHKDGIDKLETFLDEYSPQMEEQSITNLIKLIHNIRKYDGTPMTTRVTEGFGDRADRGNLGPKRVDFDKEKEKHTEREGEPDDYVVLEQNDVERRIKGHREDSEKQTGPDTGLDASVVGSGAAAITKQITSWDFEPNKGDYKRGARGDKIDDNPEIEKSPLDSFLADLKKSEDGDEYVEDLEIDEDIKILEVDADEHRGTYTGNSAAYQHNQSYRTKFNTLKKQDDDIKDLKWTDNHELSEEIQEKIKQDLKIFDMEIEEIDEIDLPSPYPNNSTEVKQELDKMATKHKNFRKDKKLEVKITRAMKSQDKDLVESFVTLGKILDIGVKRSDKMNLTSKKIQPLIDDTRTIVLTLKQKYNRPRPQELFEYYNIDLTPEELESADTPSYPSGHAFQSRILAMALTEKYPQHEKRFRGLANEMAENRVIAGVHFPSDSIAGKVLADELYDKLNTDKLKI